MFNEYENEKDAEAEKTLDYSAWLIIESQKFIEKFEAASLRQKQKLLPQLAYFKGKLGYEKRQVDRLLGNEL